MHHFLIPPSALLSIRTEIARLVRINTRQNGIPFIAPTDLTKTATQIATEYGVEMVPARALVSRLAIECGQTTVSCSA